MPIVAIGAAVFADMAVGAAGFSAVLAGTATLATTFEAVAAVGATLGAIGAVTGVKELKTAGMVIGGIGGVGALANAVGAFGADATMSSIFGSSGVTAPDINPAQGLDTAGLINDSGINTPLDATAATSSSDVIDTANSIAASSGTNDLAVNPGADSLSATTGNAATESGSQVGNNLSMVAPNSPDTATAANKAPSDTASTASTSSKLTDDEGNPLAGTSVTGMPTSISTADNSWLKQQYPNPADGVVAKNGATGNSFSYSTAAGWQPVAAASPSFFTSQAGGLIGMGAIQAAGSFLSGAFNPLTPAQVAAYNAQAAQNNASASLTQKQVANMNSPIPVAARTAPPTPPGFINSPMGAPA